MTRSKWIFPVVAIASCAIAGFAYAAMPIGQKDKMFHPDEVSAKRGDAVHIGNDDTVVHNVIVVSPGGKTSNLGIMKPGDSIDVLLDEEGDFALRCGIHPKMKMVVHSTSSR